MLTVKLVMAFVPVPPLLPPPGPVLNEPVVLPARGTLFALKPKTLQMIVLSSGNDVTGVQVRTVLPEFHDGVVNTIEEPSY